ncbi:hypothetical protein AAL_03697 [Moelleriella libera RCEF 2490]|uniref:Uncharacterized protein n=1 Tax=Moelleriella libera RCEF 2490 TaxID=1081109 RepID=A0A168DGT9_9HYPO|nr:hypothetical protein AAL_03697 [Moelleriella libera RCEF 2490]
MGFFSALASKRKPKPAPVSSASTISLPRETSFAQPDRRISNDDETRSLAPQPMQRANLPVPHQLASEPQARKSIRDVLHLLVLIVSAIGIGFSWSLLAPGASRYLSGLVRLPIGAGILFATAFLWSFAELIVRCMRRWKTGLPSAAHICVCLCIFASSVGLSVLIFFQLYWNRCDDKKDDDDDDDDDRFGQFISIWRCARARPPLYLGVAILLALMAFARNSHLHQRMH